MGNQESGFHDIVQRTVEARESGEKEPAVLVDGFSLRSAHEVKAEVQRREKERRSADRSIRKRPSREERIKEEKTNLIDKLREGTSPRRTKLSAEEVALCGDFISFMGEKAFADATVLSGRLTGTIGYYGGEEKPPEVEATWSTRGYPVGRYCYDMYYEDSQEEPEPVSYNFDPELGSTPVYAGRYNGPIYLHHPVFLCEDGLLRRMDAESERMRDVEEALGDKIGHLEIKNLSTILVEYGANAEL